MARSKPGRPPVEDVYQLIGSQGWDTDIFREFMEIGIVSPTLIANALGKKRNVVKPDGDLMKPATQTVNGWVDRWVKKYGHSEIDV